MTSKMSHENYLVIATVGLVIPLGAVCLNMYLYMYVCDLYLNLYFELYLYFTYMFALLELA